MVASFLKNNCSTLGILKYPKESYLFPGDMSLSSDFLIPKRLNLEKFPLAKALPLDDNLWPSFEIESLLKCALVIRCSVAALRVNKAYPIFPFWTSVLVNSSIIFIWQGRSVILLFIIE